MNNVINLTSAIQNSRDKSAETLYTYIKPPFKLGRTSYANVVHLVL